MDAHSFYLLGLNTLVEPVVDNGRIQVIPPKGLSDEGKVEWENTFLGHFVGRKLPYSAANTLAHRLWSDDRLDEVLSAENGYFFFRTVIPVNNRDHTTPFTNNFLNPTMHALIRLTNNCNLNCTRVPTQKEE